MENSHIPRVKDIDVNPVIAAISKNKYLAFALAIFVVAIFALMLIHKTDQEGKFTELTTYALMIIFAPIVFLVYYQIKSDNAKKSQLILNKIESVEKSSIDTNKLISDLINQFYYKEIFNHPYHSNESMDFWKNLIKYAKKEILSINLLPVEALMNNDNLEKSLAALHAHNDFHRNSGGCIFCERIFIVKNVAAASDYQQAFELHTKYHVDFKIFIGTDNENLYQKIIKNQESFIICDQRIVGIFKFDANMIVKEIHPSTEEKDIENSINLFKEIKINSLSLSAIKERKGYNTETRKNDLQAQPIHYESYSI